MQAPRRRDLGPSISGLMAQFEMDSNPDTCLNP